MSISRRSFLKLAGLTTVAVAGTALFTGCTVATYLQIELDENVRKQICGGEPTAEQNKLIDTYLSLLNLALFACPMVGVKELNLEQAMQKINEALDQAETKYPDRVDEIAQIRKYMEMFTIVTDENGKVVAEGFGYGKITVKITTKSKAAAQALRDALAEAVA